MLYPETNALSITEKFNHVMHILFTGLAVGFLQLMIAFSLAKLLFSGRLSPYVSEGIGLFFATAMFSTLITVIFSTKQQLFPSMQSSLVLITLGIVSSMTIQSDKSFLPTVLIMISVTTFISGVIFYVFARMRWVQLIRYVPYPVIGGFLGGYGILLIWSGLSQSLPSGLNGITLSQLLNVNSVVVWLPSLIIGFLLVLGTRRSQHYLILPAILLLSSITIHLWLATRNLTVPEATSDAILVGNLDSITWFLPFTINMVEVDFQAILGQWEQIIMVAFVGLMHMLLNLSSLEIVMEDKIDIETEVETSGILNIVLGLMGGHAFFQSISVSTLNHKFSTKSQMTYLVAAGFIGIVMVFGTKILQLIPVAVTGGLLIYVGLDFIDTWIFQGWRRFTVTEYAALLLIMLIVVFVGILEGFLLGLAIMLCIFVVSYSQANIVYRATSASTIASTIEHTPHFAAALPTLRQGIYILELTGFLFFGSSKRIIDVVETRLQDNMQNDLQFLIIDFRRVTGMDSSAILTIQNILLLAHRHQFKLYLSAVEDHKQPLRILQRLNMTQSLYFSADLDHALGICETSLLETSGTTQAYIPSTNSAQIADLGMRKADAKTLTGYMTRTQHKAGDIITTNDDLADSIFFLEIGQVSVFIDSDNERIRLLTINMGSLFGAVEFLLGATRSTTTICNTDSIIWKLTQDNLVKLQYEEPSLAFAFEHMLLNLLAKRITASNELIRVLR